MPEETNATTSPVVVGPPVVNVEKEGYIIEQVHFGGTSSMRGFSYYTPKFPRTTPEETSKSFEIVKAKYGEDVIVSLVNASLRGGLAVKARNEVPKLAPEDKGNPSKIQENLVAIEKLRTESPVLVTAEVADSWKPGERALTLQGLATKMAAAFRDGNIAEAMEYMRQINEKAGLNEEEESGGEGEAEPAVTQ